MRMTDKEMLAYCRRHLRYADGRIFWVKPPVGWIQIGDRAGNLGYRYRYLKAKGHLYGEHRVIWLMHHGRMPAEIDHIDNNPINNRIENLRECSRTENNRARKQLAKGKTSKYRGVFFDKQKNKWHATITLPKLKHIGFFTDEKSAARAYNEAAAKHFGEYAAVNKV